MTKSKCLLSFSKDPVYRFLSLFVTTQTIPIETSVQEFPSFKETSGREIAFNGSKFLGNTIVYSEGSANLVHSDGVIEPLISDSVVDRLQILPIPVNWNGYEAKKFEFFISRSHAPQLLAYRIVPIRLMLTKDPGDSVTTNNTYEFVVDKTLPTTNCRLVNP